MTRKTRLSLAFASIAVASAAVIPAVATTASAAPVAAPVPSPFKTRTYPTINPKPIPTSNPAPLSAHWGYFTKNMCYKDAPGFARTALRGAGYKVVNNPPNAVLGSNGTTIVEVAFAPAQTSYNPRDFSTIHFNVTAISSDGNNAEYARNRVRESIVKQTYLDYC
ncbi:hypothetical protein ABZ860_06245 [Microbispora sp. NPDC046973]|uniref:hypothetical protein n=1 Tax=Microbispora sp. NPDC046973 TaxID=3155022 RepID=UPI0033EB8718